MAAVPIRPNRRGPPPNELISPSDPMGFIGRLLEDFGKHTNSEGEWIGDPEVAPNYTKKHDQEVGAMQGVFKGIIPQLEQTDQGPKPFGFGFVTPQNYAPSQLSPLQLWDYILGRST